MEWKNRRKREKEKINAIYFFSFFFSLYFSFIKIFSFTIKRKKRKTTNEVFVNLFAHNSRANRRREYSGCFSLQTRFYWSISISGENNQSFNFVVAFFVVFVFFVFASIRLGGVILKFDGENIQKSMLVLYYLLVFLMLSVSIIRL